MTGDFCNTRKKKSIEGGVKSLALKQDELGRLQDKLSFRDVGTRGGRGDGGVGPPYFGRSVNPISTRGVD